MYNMTFWDRLKDEYQRQGFTVEQLSKLSGVSTHTLQGWFAKKTMPKIDACLKVAKALGVSIEYLLTGEETALPDDEFVKQAEFHDAKGSVVDGEDGEESVFVPLVRQRVSAGPGQEFLPASSFCGNVCILKRMTRGIDPGSLIAARVRGDSMSGIQLNDGDIVVFTRTLTDAGEGIYVISLYGEVRVKRIAFQPSRHQIIILSENPKYSPEEIDEKNENLRILGKVIGWIHCQPY